MSKTNVVLAWKDAEYRMSLSPDQLAEVPAHPAGMVELSDAELSQVAGGNAADSGTGTGSGGGCNCFCQCSSPE